MSDFYTATLRQLVDQGVLETGMTVLVVCGGGYDRDALLGAGFRQVTISNLDTRMKGDEFAPCAWSFQDAENLTYPDGAFDLVVAHAGLHHCASPHRGLLEMYRVARRAIFVFEPRDSALARLGVRLGFGQDYETSAVYNNGLTMGGLRNTHIPNYVYRWTEREIEKTIASFDPVARPRHHYFYTFKLNTPRLATLKNPAYRILLRAGLPLLKLLALLAPRQTNTFAWAVQKPQLPRDLQPWLAWEDGRAALNHAWMHRRFSRPAGPPNP
jgi:ubiquinone/menaquinone biosynthesis C-methylase UbiE